MNEQVLPVLAFVELNPSWTHCTIKMSDIVRYDTFVMVKERQLVPRAVALSCTVSRVEPIPVRILQETIVVTSELFTVSAHSTSQHD